MYKYLLGLFCLYSVNSLAPKKFPNGKIIKFNANRMDPANDLYLSNYSENEEGSSFSLYYKGSHWSDVSLDLIGFFNARNAAIAALSAGMFYDSKQPTKLNIECLSSFKGVTRRQECLFRDPLIGVFEDFAHHPSSLKETIRTVSYTHLRAHETV